MLSCVCGHCQSYYIVRALTFIRAHINDLSHWWFKILNSYWEPWHYRKQGMVGGSRLLCMCLLRIELNTNRT